MASILSVSQLSASYGGLVAVDGVSLSLEAGDVLGVAGPNGAGKTSLLRAIAGLVRPARGQVSFDGEVIIDVAARLMKGPRWAVQHGLIIVPEGRQLFGELTVEENLRFGAYVIGARDVDADLGRVFELFPKLRQRSRQTAVTLSGGEQQMVAIGRALMAKPRLLLLDEMSLGLAPVVATEVCAALLSLREQTNLSMVIVDESLKRLSKMASRILFMSRGRVHTELSTDQLVIDEASYLLSHF